MTDIYRELDEIRQRLKKVESQMVFLFRKKGIAMQEAPQYPVSAAVMEFLRKGDTKGAIRAFVEEAGASLKDAKVFIDTLRVDRSWTEAERYSSARPAVDRILYAAQ
jgi:hypothetical protein